MTATLFDAGAPTVRDRDPTTSRQAPGPLGRNRGCAEVLLIIAAAGPHGATCADVLHQLTDADRGNTARRLTDLLHAGLIYRGGFTRTRGNGRPQQVNHITDDGLALVATARHLLSEASAGVVASHPPREAGGPSRALGPVRTSPGTTSGASLSVASATPEGPTNETDPRMQAGAGSDESQRHHCDTTPAR